MFGHRGDGQEVRHLRISGGLDIEELSPKDERSKLLREKLTIIQEAQVSAGFAAASNLQLLRRDALLRDFNFQPPVLSAVRTAPFEGHHVVGPEPNVLQARVRAIRQADRMTGSSVTFARQKEVKTSTKTSSKKTAPRPSVFDRLGSPPSTTQTTVTQEPPFPAGPEGPVHGPSKEARSVASFLLLPQPRNVDGSQVGARLADFAPHWRSLLGNCRATGIVEDGVGIAFQQRPQLTHQSISFRTRYSRQDLQQAVDALLIKGAIERVVNVRSLGFYSRLFLVPKKTGDLRPVIDLSTLNHHMVVPHFKMETQGSVRSAIRSQEWAVSIDIRDHHWGWPPGFLAKNQLPTQAPDRITVPGIAHLNAPEPERMLRPVRQLKLYIRDSERIRGGRQRMFIHWTAASEISWGAT